MGKIIFLIAIVFLLSCSNYIDKNHGYIVSVGDIAPNFTTVSSSGDSINLQELRGRIVMLQFTASWCSVCRKEMPFIESEIWQIHKDKNFVVFGIDRDEPLEKVQEFKSQMKITYPLLLDNNADIFALYAKKRAGVTRNVIIDKNGKIVYLTRLFNRDEFDIMKNKINELLIN